MTQPNRPLSPHLQVYKPQLTSMLSILHRLTGFALVVGLLPFIWWLMTAAACPECYVHAQKFFGSTVGQLLLLGWSWSLFYHMCNGVRHLFWDAGYGFGLKTAYASGWAVVFGACVFTALAWCLPF